MAKQKTINLVEEELLAQSNLRKYAFIKNEIISAMMKVPMVNHDILLNRLCQINNITREDFLMIHDAEKQAIEDHMKRYK